MSLKQAETQQFSDFSNMYTPARFKILKELQDLKSLLKNLTCSCTDSYSREGSENNSELLITLNLFQLAIMIGLVIALMCNFYSITEPGWKEIAIKAVAFGAIVTFWPILLLVISFMTCYSKWFKEEEKTENVKNFKANSKLSNSPNIRFLKNQIPTRH